MNTTTSNTHQELLIQLGESLLTIGKEMKMQHGHEFTCVTPALDQVLFITGVQEMINVKQIATLLAVTSAAATQHIAALEKQGAVTRVMSEKDRREIIVRLTPKGHELFKKIRANHLRLLEETFSGLNDDELKIVADLITKASKKYR